MNTGLDQYMDIFKDAVEDSAAKITKSFEKILIEVIILFMVIPRKINFTQMGRYGSHVEQTYRNAFGLKKSKCIDWLKLNVSLAKRFHPHTRGYVCLKGGIRLQRRGSV